MSILGNSSCLFWLISFHTEKNRDCICGLKYWMKPLFLLIIYQVFSCIKMANYRIHNKFFNWWRLGMMWFYWFFIILVNRSSVCVLLVGLASVGIIACKAWIKICFYLRFELSFCYFLAFFEFYKILRR
jgi:hypothetical protein